MASLSLVFLSEQLLIAREWYSIIRTPAINKSNTTAAFNPQISRFICEVGLQKWIRSITLRLLAHLSWTSVILPTSEENGIFMLDMVFLAR